MSPREGNPRWYRPALAALGAGLALALPAAAVDDAEYERITPARTPGEELRRAVRALPRQWLGPEFRIKGSYGIEYRNHVNFRGREYEVRLRGPIVKRKRGLGLTVEVRF